MSQPLASRSMIHARADQLVKLLQACDELGGSAGDVSNLVGSVLIRALRFDWKYQVLAENPQFNDLVAIHLGFMRRYDDPAHERRMRKLNSMIHLIESWVKQNESFKHGQEIETDINDVKEYLQDFLASVKRSLASVQEGKADDKEVKERVSLQLLEIRNLFSKFFYFLRSYESDGKLIRNQFLFVDQYLEAVELILQQPFSVKPVTE